MKGVLFVLALLTAASVANAYDIARTLRFTNDGNINGFRALNQPHLRRVSGVDDPIDGIECKHVSDNRGKVWQCSVLNSESLRLGAYSVSCDKNSDKTAYLVSTCTIEYELLPQAIKIISREKEPVISTLPAEITIQSVNIGSAEFVTPKVEAKKVQHGETSESKNYAKDLMVIYVIIIGCAMLFKVFDYFKEWVDGKIGREQDRLLPDVNAPVSANDGNVASNDTKNVDAPKDTTPDPVPCTHPALRNLRVKNPERFPRMKLLCSSCNKRVRLVDLHAAADADHREGHDDVHTSGAASVSKKQASKKCSRESHEW